MNTYIGTKIINAMPMTRASYNAMRGWALPADENGLDDGYLVEYTDGGVPNHADFAGYVSWSPAEQFEATYIDVGNIDALKPHQQRVVAEKVDLDSKIGKLSVFLLTAYFKNLHDDEQLRLWLQAKAMRAYSDILDERIVCFQ